VQTLIKTCFKIYGDTYLQMTYFCGTPDVHVAIFMALLIKNICDMKTINGTAFVPRSGANTFPMALPAHSGPWPLVQCVGGLRRTSRTYGDGSNSDDVLCTILISYLNTGGFGAGEYFLLEGNYMYNA
jgi:hypothetical protein